MFISEKKNPSGATPNEWRVEAERDLNIEAAKKSSESFKMKEPGTSVLVTKNREMPIPAEFEKQVKGKVKDIPDLLFTVVNKMHLVIDCHELKKVSEVYATLQAGMEDARVIKN